MKSLFVCLFVWAVWLASSLSNAWRWERSNWHFTWTPPVTCTLLDCRRNHIIPNSRPGESDPQLFHHCTRARSLRQSQRPQTLPLCTPESLRRLVWNFSLISFLSAWMVFAPRISLSDFFVYFLLCRSCVSRPFDVLRLTSVSHSLF